MKHLDLMSGEYIIKMYTWLSICSEIKYNTPTLTIGSLEDNKGTMDTLRESSTF